MLLGIDPETHDHLAFDIDEAILLFGRWVETKLDERTGGKKPTPKHKLADLLKDHSATNKFSIAAITKAMGGKWLLEGPVH